MREIGRIAQGFFPTQPRIVESISFLLKPPTSGKLTVLDAGCGEGAAIADLRAHWLKSASDLTVKLYGVESDRARCAMSDKIFRNTGGESLWSPIEDCEAQDAASLLWFNPPYDRVRMGGRLETLLLAQVRDWAVRNGHMVMIVPDYILADKATSLAVAVERDFKLIALYRYPEPEYSQFKQCVLIAQRRDKALNKNKVEFPAWALNPKSWATLPTARYPHPIQLVPATDDVFLRRTNIGKELILHTLSRSPLRSSLLREAMAPAPKVERPLLPLKEGHLALALAGGLCDGAIDTEQGKVLIKGTLESKVCKVSTRPKIDSDGMKCGDIETHRTVYVMNVRCLRANGKIEDYSSNEGENETVEKLDGEPIAAEDSNG